MVRRQKPTAATQRSVAARKAAALRTVTGTQPEALRQQCLEALAPCAQADLALFYRAGVVSNGVAIRDVQLRSAGCSTEVLRGLRERLGAPEFRTQWGAMLRSTWQADRWAYATRVTPWDNRFVADSQMASVEPIPPPR